jgi:hypothetical protein
MDPSVEPGAVSSVGSLSLRAMPKSMSFTLPPGVSIMFAGLMSR